MENVSGKICLAVILLFFPNAAFSQSAEAVKQTRQIVSEIVERSYPELNGAKIDVRTFVSGTNYFKSQFAISRFLTFRKITYVIFVNAEVFRRKAPEDGIRAILAHELAHILYFQRKSRFQLLALAALSDKNFNAKFERKADLEAIARGYGSGLRSYREWLYQNIPPQAIEAKKRDYFSPAEIDAMLRILRAKPEMLGIWRNRVPRSFKEIEGEKR